MKNRKQLFRLLPKIILLFALALTSCRAAPQPTPEASPTPFPPSPTPAPTDTPTLTPTATLPPDFGMAAMITGNPTFPVIAAHRSGEKLVMIGGQDAAGNQKPSGVVWILPSNETVVIYFGDDGRPQKAQIGEKSALYSGYTDTSVNVDIPLQDGAKMPYPNIQVAASMLQGFTPTNPLGPLYDILRPGVYAAGLVSCASGFVLQGGLAAVGCPSPLYSSFRQLETASAAESNKVLELTSSTLETTACGAPGCLAQILQVASQAAAANGSSQPGGPAGPTQPGETPQPTQAEIAAPPTPTATIYVPPPPPPTSTPDTRVKSTPTKKPEKKPEATPTKR